MHRIGVVIPCYNAAFFIKETLQSVMAQTHQPNEVIVVDDGSTDESCQIVRDFIEEYPVLKLVEQENARPAAARNNGVRYLKNCDLIAFCDSDDVWHADKLAEQLAVFVNAKDSKLGCVYGASQSIDATGSKLGALRQPDSNLRGDVARAVANGAPILGSMSGVMVTRQAFEDVGGFDPDFWGDEDLEFFIRLSQIYHFEFAPKAIAYLRWHGDNRSQDHEKLLRMKNQIFSKHNSLMSSDNRLVASIARQFMAFQVKQMLRQRHFVTVVTWLVSPKNVLENQDIFHGDGRDILLGCYRRFWWLRQGAWLFHKVTRRGS